MAMDPVPKLDELVRLFEGDPVPRQADEHVSGGGVTDWRQDWPFTSVTFRTVREPVVVELSINPGYEWLSILAIRSGQELFRIEAGDVRSVEVERLHDREELHVSFRRPDVETLRLLLKPAVGISWRLFNPPTSGSA